MALEFKEYLGSSTKEEYGQAPFSLNIKESMNALTTVAKNSLMVDIEGIHVGPTRNYTWYTEQALKGSILTWTRPYQRPLILHHNEKDGRTIGRVLAAEYSDVNTRSNTGALTFTCNVADEDGIKGVKDGRLKTVSIGVMAHDVRCSICGSQIELDSEGMPVCGHFKGEEYDNETCYWMIYSMEAKELSYVIVPSDKFAHNIRMYSPSNYTKDLTESAENKGEFEMTIKKNIEAKEAEVIVEDAEKEQAIPQATSLEKGENKSECKTVEELESIVSELKSEVAKFKKENEELTSIRKQVEDELIAANKELKEYAVDKITSLRESLGRPQIATESLLLRSKDSLTDAIADLKEELQFTSKKDVNLTESTVIEKSVDVKESVKDVKPTAEDINKIEIPVQESLIDAEKDSSTSEEDKKENESLDVKESEELSNIEYDKILDNITNFYNL